MHKTPLLSKCTIPDSTKTTMLQNALRKKHQFENPLWENDKISYKQAKTKEKAEGNTSLSTLHRKTFHRINFEGYNQKRDMNKYHRSNSITIGNWNIRSRVNFAAKNEIIKRVSPLILPKHAVAQRRNKATQLQCIQPSPSRQWDQQTKRCLSNPLVTLMHLNICS